MKICVLTHTFPKYKNDTTAAFMHPFVLGLIKNGNDVTVLTPFHPRLRIKEFPYKVITYKYIWPNSFHRLGYSQTLLEGTNFKLETYLLAPFLYFFGFLSLLNLLKKEHFDLVSTHWILPNGFIAYLVWLILKTPYTVSLAGSDVYLANKNIFFSFMARKAAQKAGLVSADSPQYIKELKKTGAKFKRAHVVPYPADTSLLHPNSSGVSELKKNLQISERDVLLLAVGRLIHKKGFQYLLPAFQKVSQKKKNVFLVMVGDGDLKHNLEMLSLKLKIENNVRFVGNIERDKIGLFYNVADIFIMPSIKDEQGNIDDRPVALLEAIACGKPVVATNFPGNSLSIKDSVSGFLVPQKNIDAMSSAILRLIKSDSLRRSMSYEAKKIAREQFDMVEVGKKNTELFKSMIKNK